MKKIWKWILGVFIILVVVAALVAVPFVMRRVVQANAPTVAGAAPQARGWNGGPMMRGFENQPGQGFQHPQVPGFNGQRGPMMNWGRGFNRGFSPFGFGFMFIGGLLRLIPLALFGLLLFGVYQLGKRAGMRSGPLQAAPVPAQPAPMPPAPDKIVASDDSLPPAA